MDIEALYRKYGPMVLRRCRKLLRDEDASLDCLHEIFARLLEQDFEKIEYPSSFLYTMATRLCLDKLRSAAARHSGNADLLHLIADSRDLEEQAFASRMLDRIFHRQIPSTRVMAVMHYVDGLTYEEVGEQMQLSAAGVRRRMQKLRTRVAQFSGKETL